MIRHYLLIALRSFGRDKSAAFINLVGLSTALASTLFVYLWVVDELRIDHYNVNDDKLYQVMQNLPEGDGIHTIEGTQGKLAEALAQEVPEVAYATTVVPATWFSNDGLIGINDNFIIARPQFISRDYLKVFTCHILEGDTANLLPDIHAIAISRDIALRLFQSTDNVVGKLIEWKFEKYTGTYHVTGIFEDLPSNATAPFDLLFNYRAFVEMRPWDENWFNSDPSTYVLLQPGTDVDALDRKIAGFVKAREPQSGSTLFVQKFSDRYLHSSYENGQPSGGRILYVHLLSTIGAVILLIACINFVNLSTAKATRRMKEVAVKKSVGASRMSLVTQYLAESALASFLSLLTALGLVWMLLPQFNVMTGKQLHLQASSELVTGIFLLFIISSLLAGSFPAFYLSRFSPATILRGKVRTGLGDLLARKGLVIFQFAVSVILIVGVWVMYAQMEYVQNKELGYDKDNVVAFQLTGQNESRLTSFRDAVEEIPGVVSVGTYGHNLVGDHGSIELNWEGKDPNMHMPFGNIEVGEHFIETMGIELKEGHLPSMQRNPESQIILNEEAVRVMSLKDPVGRKVRYWGMESEIVGVVKDFNFESLHEPIKPSFFRVYPIEPSFIVKIEKGKEAETIQAIEKLYKSFATGYPFDFKFIDEDYQKLYVSERRVSQLSRYFAIIAIIISCLGLFGLASFAAEKRVKEIGIRKVLGSGVTGIVTLLSIDFTRIVIVAIVMALPVSYYMARAWLVSFAFRIVLHWWYFAGAGLAALVIAWAAIGMQTIKAARANPVDSLRTE